MNNYEALCTYIHSLRFNTDQAPYRKNRPINGIFPSQIIHGLMWRLAEQAHLMAGKTQTKYSNFNQTEFVNRNLLAEEGEAFKAWAKKENERIPDMLGQIMVNGYKVTCTWNDNNQCYIATFTGKEDAKHNVNKALSSRSDDWFEALAMNTFKHVILFKSGVWEGDTTKNNWG